MSNHHFDFGWEHLKFVVVHPAKEANTTEDIEEAGASKQAGAEMSF